MASGRSARGDRGAPAVLQRANRAGRSPSAVCLPAVAGRIAPRKAGRRRRPRRSRVRTRRTLGG